MQDSSGQKNEGLATVEQAARFLQISRAKLYLMMDKGDLAYVKIDKCRRLPWKALQELVQRLTIPARA